MDRFLSKRFLLTAACGAVILSSALTYGAFSTQYEFLNSFETSSVDIGLEQLCVNDEGEEVYLKGDSVCPGQVVSYIPRVINNSASCYVRVRFDIEMEKEEAEPISLSDAVGIGDDWIKRGDCFYSTRVLKSGESSDVFKGIVVPDNWNGETASGFAIKATADAIQAVNFNPDFASIMPWGSVGISSSRQSRSLVVGKATAYEDARIVFNNSNSFECETDNLFAGFRSMLPGDVYRQDVPVVNKSGKRLKIYFKTENDDSKMLELVDLKLSFNGNCIYDGPLSSSELQSFINVMNLKPGEEQMLGFEISLPEETGNEYSQMNDSVKWIIAAKVDNQSSGGSSRIVRTGDLIGLTLITLLCICAVTSAIMALILIRSRRKK